MALGNHKSYLKNMKKCGAIFWKNAVHKSVLFESRISKFIQKSLKALEIIVQKLKAFIHMTLH